MAMYVNTNVVSLNAQRNLNTNTSGLAVSMQRLSSGLRLNSAKDDAAGMAVSTSFTTQIRGNNQAIRNANDGISMAQTAEGAISQVLGNVQRIREVAVQAANSTLTNAQRSKLQAEVDQLTQENSRIVQTTNYNGIGLLSASAGNVSGGNGLFGAAGATFQVGADGTGTNQITMATGSGNGQVTDLGAGVGAGGLGSAFSSSLTATGTLNLSTSAAASAAIDHLDSVLNNLVQTRTSWGAVQNRFESVIANLSNYVENATASRSRVMDTDFAAETANMTRSQILQQAGTSILSQANQLPQAALSLLR
jgi:flagellin